MTCTHDMHNIPECTSNYFIGAGRPYRHALALGNYAGVGCASEMSPASHKKIAATMIRDSGLSSPWFAVAHGRGDVGRIA